MHPSPLRLALGGMAALAAGIGVARFIYTPILPPMAEALSLSASQAGLIASANFLGYLAGAMLAASSALRGSRRTYLIAALAVSALGLAAMALTGSFALHLLLRFIGGLASAFILVFASALVLEQLAASGRDRLSSVHFAGVGVGIALSALAVNAATSLGGDWRTMWLAGAVLGLTGLGVAAVYLPSDAPSATAVPKAGASRASFALKAIIIAYGLFGFGYIITATFIVAQVRAAPEIAALEPYVWVLFGLVGVPSVAFWMWIAGRIGVLPAFAAACLIEAAGIATGVLWISTPGILIAILAVGGTFMAITALGLVAARRLSTGDPRPNIAWMTASFGLGQMIGPTFAGFLSDRVGGFAAPSLAAAGTLLIAAALAMAADARRLEATGSHGQGTPA